MAIDTRISNQERYYFHNNLSILLKAVEGRRTTIDFRNESSITGNIDEVDGWVRKKKMQKERNITKKKEIVR